MEKLIALRFHDIVAISVDDYEKLMKEVIANQLAGECTLGNRILAQLLNDARYRYNELKPY